MLFGASCFQRVLCSATDSTDCLEGELLIDVSSPTRHCFWEPLRRFDFQHSPVADCQNFHRMNGIGLSADEKPLTFCLASLSADVADVGLSFKDL